MRMTHVRSAIATLGLLTVSSLPAIAGAHTWDVNEVFSNADGTIQFVELREANGTPNEVNVGGQPLRSNLRPTYTIPGGARVPPTSNKFLLFATAACATLPGMPTPDYIFPAGMTPYFFVSGDSVRYGPPYDTFTFGPVPTNGTQSVNKIGGVQVNSPTNYAGATGSVNASGPPAVPDGTAGSTPVTATKLNQAGSSLSISWDTTTCTGSTSTSLLYGEGSDLPATLGGAFSLAGSQCALGGSSPFVWNPAPNALDGSGLIWWLLVKRNAGNTTEGSWGESDTGAERIGPGAGGSSGQCGVTGKDASNACGH